MFRKLDSNSFFNANVKAEISFVIFKNQLLFSGKAIAKEGEGISCCGVNLAVVVVWLLSLSFLYTAIKNQQIHVVKPPLMCNIIPIFRIF